MVRTSWSEGTVWKLEIAGILGLSGKLVSLSDLYSLHGIISSMFLRVAAGREGGGDIGDIVRLVTTEKDKVSCSVITHPQFI